MKVIYSGGVIKTTSGLVELQERIVVLLERYTSELVSTTIDLKPVSSIHQREDTHIP